MPELPYELERTVVIRATRDTVFRFFTDSTRWANWWGAGSTIDATPGGKVYIRHPNGAETVGEVLEVHAPEHIVFTYGYATGNPIPPGSSRVTIRLEPDSAGTRLHLLHEFSEPDVRDAHVQGWRFQLALFSNAVANDLFADATKSVDVWLATWGIKDDKEREASLAAIAAPEITFRDRHSSTRGVADLSAHASAVQRYKPGITMQRKGDVRHCQGMVLADWIAVDQDGKAGTSGTSVFVFGPDKKIESVTGFANPTS